ncbi:MAG: transposase [Candidatus Dormibacteraceae bacterium]
MLHPFIQDHVEPGATVITGAWRSYLGLDELGYRHDRRSQGAARRHGEDPHALLPAVHRIASLAKRWLVGTHQGSVEEAHLAEYLDELVFHFNRRRSRSRGLVFYRVLELVVGHEPVRYRDLVIASKPRPRPPSPSHPFSHPPTLNRPLAARPWRFPSTTSKGG